jgi:RNA-splicing ligase RtcB
MSWLDWLIQWISGFSQFVFGIIVGTVITGVYTWRVIIPKIMRNRDIQNLIGLLKTLAEHAEEVEELLQKVLENQGRSVS